MIAQPTPRLALSPAEAAEAIGVSLAWLRARMRDDGLPYSRIRGRVLIVPERLMKWVVAYESRSDEEQAKLEAIKLLELADRKARGVQAP